ncbi:MAG: phosphoribosylformylglycinamidine cyclo-ligase [Candidatus Margulisiibacteriota bacterium]
MDYKSAGVDIEAGNTAVQRIRHLVQRTYTPAVLGGLGHFGAFFEMPAGYQNPVLVSCTDGVGTKLMLAIAHDCIADLGVDLVAMNVYDLIGSRSKPLFFLDYIACHQLSPEQMEVLIGGMVRGCVESDCALIGGEMAEMRDVYRPGEFDLAGFAMGVVEKSRIIDGKSISAGQNVYGLPSSGVHANGFSLVRHIVNQDWFSRYGISPQALLAPTRIYVKDIAALQAKGTQLTGLAHITGGGLSENIERILPVGVEVVLSRSALRTPRLFSALQEAGQVDEEEMFCVFNMGIGMVVITPDVLTESDQCYRIGVVTPGQGRVVFNA